MSARPSESQLQSETPAAHPSIEEEVERIGKLRTMLADPACREATVAFFRTCVNVGISLVDLLPVIGDSVAVGADAMKLAKRLAQFRKTKRGRLLLVAVDQLLIDLSPDVGMGVAVAGHVPNLLTGGLFPSHAVDTVAQLRYDGPRMLAGARRLREILQGATPRQVASATAVFRDRSPARA